MICSYSWTRCYLILAECPDRFITQSSETNHRGKLGCDASLLVLAKYSSYAKIPSATIPRRIGHTSANIERGNSSDLVSGCPACYHGPEALFSQQIRTSESRTGKPHGPPHHPHSGM